MKRLLLVLQRLGVNTENYESEENAPSESEIQTAIFEAMAKNEAFKTTHITPSVNEAVEAAKTETSRIILQKAISAAKASGVEIDKEEKDIKTVMSKLTEKLNDPATKSNDKKALEDALTKARDLEVQLEQAGTDNAAKIEELTNTHTAEKAALTRSFGRQSALLAIPNLSDSVKANIKIFGGALDSALDDQFEFKEHQGKQAIFKKGETSPMYKEGSSELISEKDLIANTAKTLGFLKEAGPTGHGSPDDPNGNEGPGARGKVYSRYEENPLD